MSEEIQGREENLSPKFLAGLLVEELVRFFKLTQTHGRSNDIFVRIIDQAFEWIGILTPQTQANQVEIVYKGEQIYVNEIRLRPHSRRLHFYRSMLKFFKTRRIFGIRIQGKIQKEDLRVALWVLAQIESANDKSVQEAVKTLHSRRIYGFEIIPFKMTVETDGGTSNHLEVGATAIGLVKRIHEFIEICFFNANQIESFAVDPIDLVMVDLASLPEEELLASYRYFQERKSERYLTYFVTNVAVLMAAWGRALHLPIGVVSELAGAALAHGKIFTIRNEINMHRVEFSERRRLMEMDSTLRKVWAQTDLQKLSEWEWSIPFDQDGSYQKSSTSCYLHFFSRMIRIGSWYSQKVHFLPNRSPFLPDEAMSALLQTKNEFDPTLLKLFVNWMGIYPVGTLVELQTGEVAQIFSAGSDPMRFRRPIVSILRDLNGDFLPRPILMDLSQINDKLGTYKKGIKRSLKQGEIEVPESLLRLSPIGL